jgi:hypothetical protein
MRRFLSACLLAVTACAPMGDEVDGEDDDFLADGKSDAYGVAEGSPDALGVLRLVNEADFDLLDVTVGLDRRPARNIVDWRSGDDGQEGTDDDRVFETLVQLDKIKRVGHTAFGKLLDYARANGYVWVEDCVLGKNLDEMLTADWLTVSEEQVVVADQADATTLAQIMAGMKDFDVTTLEELAEVVDESTYYFYDVTEKSSGKTFRTYAFHGPSVTHGFAFAGSGTHKIADYDQGDFIGCQAGRIRP